MLFFTTNFTSGIHWEASIIQAQKYILIKSSYTLEDAEHTTYGIALADGSDLIESVSGLSCDKQRVERLAELCTQLDLSPEHLSDVIEDFLAE